MRTKTESVTFKISLPILPFWANKKLGYVRRDLDEFKKYGITEEKLASIEKRVSDLKNYPSDSEHIGSIMICTKEKDRLTNAVRLEMTSILTRARNKYGVHSAYYRRFGTARVSALYGIELLMAARRVHYVGELELEQLAGEGLTTEILRDFKSMVELYCESLLVQEDAIADRIIATEHRVKEANAVYSIVVNLCHTGKRIWESKCVPRYKHYVIYKTSPQKRKEKTKLTEKETIVAEVANQDISTSDIKE